MFWKYNLTSCPHLEVLLNKEDVTLYEIMNEEEVVQECKVQNKKLIEYLGRPEVMELLVTLATVEPSEEQDEKLRYKNSNIACELLTCDVPSLNERLAGNEALLHKLYSFLERPPPLNPLLASFFSKTLQGLVMRRAEQVLEFLKAQEDTLGLLLKHLGTSAIMDLLLKLITNVEGCDMKQNVLPWLDGQHVVQKLVALLHPSVESNRHCNAAQLLLDVIRISRDNLRTGSSSENSEPDIILTRLEAPETASQLLELMLSGEERSETAIVGGVAVLLALLDTARTHGEDSLIASESSQADGEDAQRVVRNTVQAIVPHLHSLHDVLINPPKKAAVRTTAELLDPPLGNTRLQVCRLIVALVGTQDPAVHAKLAELGTLDVMLDLFFRYQWNNFLHTQVEQCVALVLEGSSPAQRRLSVLRKDGGSQEVSPPSSPSTPPLIAPTDAEQTPVNTEAIEEHVPPAKEHSDDEAEGQDKEPYVLLLNLFAQCRLIERTLEAWKVTETDESKPGKQRFGYLGHLVLIANHIEKKLGSDSSLLARLIPEPSVSEAWVAFVSGPLAELNKIQSECLGGQHPARMVTQESEDGEFQNIPFPQEDSVLQTFTELQTRYTTTPFVDSFGYDDNQFFEGEDPMHISDVPVPLGYRISSEEMDRRAELFGQVCRQKMMVDEDDLDDQELTFQTAASSNSRVRGRLSSDEDNSEEEEGEREGPEGREASALTMEVDSTDPWPSLEGSTLETVAPIQDVDPWASTEVSTPAESQAESSETPQAEGWADFCSFAFTASPEGEKAKDSENNLGQASDNNANANKQKEPEAEAAGGFERSELMDNFRFLSQGLMTSPADQATPPIPTPEVSSEALEITPASTEEEKPSLNVQTIEETSASPEPMAMDMQE